MEAQKDYELTEQQVQSIGPQNAININIGVLGHIDSGKTSLAKALSRVTSTASLDKSPASKERGITLDLGFSAFFMKIPKEQDKFKDCKETYIQFTLVDCPGHASLIQTILGGASIIDIMFLVIDINEGFQTQTSECLVIGELLMQKIIVILNQVDKIPLENRQQIVQKQVNLIRKIFSQTQFGDKVPIIPISAMVGANQTEKQAENIEFLLQTLIQNIDVPSRNQDGPFLYLIDHCFPIQGQGSVVTGTIIQGSIQAGEQVEFPGLNMAKKMKSMQMFHKPIERAIQGDRIGMLFTQLDHTQAKFHITSGHQTVMAVMKLFGCEVEEEQYIIYEKMQKKFNFSQEGIVGAIQFQYDREYKYIEDYESVKGKQNFICFVLLEFEKPLIATLGTMIIGSKLDSDITINQCRLAFYGPILENIDEKQLQEDNQLKIFNMKVRQGNVEKIVDNYSVLVKDLFKKDTNINMFLNKIVVLSLTGNEAQIHSSFGKSGQVKIMFEKGIHFVNEANIEREIVQDDGTTKKEEQKIDTPPTTNTKEKQEFKQDELEPEPAQQININGKIIDLDNKQSIEGLVLQSEVLLQYKKYFFTKKK